jgi:HEAT repeat protein
VLSQLDDDELFSGTAGFIGRAAAVLTPEQRLRAIAGLRRGLGMADRNDRAAAAETLGELEAFEALPDLIDISSRDPDPIVRATALEAVAEFGEQEGVLEAIQAGFSDRERRVRQGAAVAAGHLADPRFEPIVREAARREPRWSRLPYRRALHEIRAARR